MNSEISAVRGLRSPAGKLVALDLPMLGGKAVATNVPASRPASQPASKPPVGTEVKRDAAIKMPVKIDRAA